MGITSFNGFTHEDWDDYDLSNDVALIELPSPITFNDYIKPSCLPKSGNAVSAGEMVSVIGWASPPTRPAASLLNCARSTTCPLSPTGSAMTSTALLATVWSVLTPPVDVDPATVTLVALSSSIDNFKSYPFFKCRPWAM